MKNKITKRDFSRFSKRNTHKRRRREDQVSKIKEELESIKLSYDGASFSVKEDLGPRGRVSNSPSGRERVSRGVFCGSKGGFGFVTLDPEECERDVFIPEDKTRGAIHGDLVEVIYRRYKTPFGEEKTEGRVKKIVEYGRQNLIGALMREPSYMHGRRRIPGRYYIYPDDPKISVLPTLREIGDAREGDKLVVKLLRDNPYELECEVVANLGDSLSLSANYEAILEESGIPREFTSEELALAEREAQKPLSEEGRVRFPRLKVLTVDGEDAKDLDDAVSIRKLPNGYKLYVHIADVSCYVEEKTPLDRCAMGRGNSVYFTDKVVPMLPPALSNGACSLNPMEDKYALTATVTLSEEGRILKCELQPSIIQSSVRGVYSEVNALFDGTADAALCEKYSSVAGALSRMRELYLILKRRSEQRGATELSPSECRILLDERGEVTDICRRTRGDAERMIEQFMITANEAVATLLYEKGVPCVYRVHSEPPAEKLAEFVNYVHSLGFDTSYISMEKCDSRSLSALLREADERGLLPQISYSLLRSMSKAEYSAVCARHFGLGIEKYCHFTSPIRRLSDLATHRIIHKVLLGQKRAESYSSYARRAAKAATECELRAVSAERRIENLYKTVYMSQRLGEEFDGVVSSVRSFGVFVELENTCEGLIPLSSLPGFAVFEESFSRMRVGGRVYSVGLAVRVRLEECDVVRGKLGFSLVE